MRTLPYTHILGNLKHQKVLNYSLWTTLSWFCQRLQIVMCSTFIPLSRTAVQCNKITFSHVATSCRKGYTTAHIHCRHASKSASCQLHDDFYDDPITHMLIMHLLHLYDGNTGTCAAVTKNHSAILSKTEEMETNRGKKMQPTNYDIRKEETLANRDAASTTSAYRILLHYASTIL